MTISAPDLLILARQLCELSSEAGNRSAISRAYYSVYHSCLEWEKTFPCLGSNTGPNGGVHQELLNRLRNPAPELRDAETRGLCRVVAARVEALRTKRGAADYELAAPNHTGIDAANCCAQAAEILEQIGVAIPASDGPSDPPEDPSPPPPPPPAPAPRPSPPSNGRPSLVRVR